MDIKELSVFFPLVNEEGNVSETVERAIKVLEKLKLKYEILLINDGSKDRTGQIIDELASKNPKIRVIHHAQNLGYGEALKSGFYNAKYETIVYTDGDGQFDFSEVTKFLESIKENDLVIGYRIKRQDPFFRILFKKGWSLSLFTMFGLTLKDVDCGFKMTKRAVLEKIPHLESQRGAMINAELAIKAKKFGFKVGQVGVNHYPRLKGIPTGASLNVIIRSFVDLFRLWWKLKDQKWLFIGLLFILLLAAFLRFYKIDQYMTFLGDEGRDALIMKKMLTGDIPFIGPPMSVGNIYLGPLYYYMIFIPMALFGLNPVSSVAMNALIGVLTVMMVYYLAKVWFSRVSALTAAFLYSISTVAITYSRSSWNPNPLPFFSTIVIFSLYKLHQSSNFKWLVLTGISLGAALQMHYLGLILAPIIIIALFFEFITKRDQLKNIVSGIALGIFSFLLVMSPLIAFDLKHDFLNLRAILAIFGEGEAVAFNLLSNLEKIPSIFGYNLIGRYIAGENIFLEIILASLIIYVLGANLIKWYFKKIENYPSFLLTIWIVVGCLVLSFVKHETYDHYLNFVNPAPFLAVGAAAALITGSYSRKWILRTLFGFLILILTILNLQKNPLNFPPNNQLQKTQGIAKFVLEKTEGKAFNFALLSENNYDSAYQFYLEEYGYQPKVLPFEKTAQLFVVCEDPICNPIYSPKHEIAAFGWVKIEEMWEYKGVKIYKLIHNPDQPK